MGRSGAPFAQSWTYGEVAGALGAGVHRFEIREGGRTIALAQGVERWMLRPVLLFTMGPVWIDAPETETRAEVLRMLRERLTGFLVVTPGEEGSRSGMEAARFKDVMTPATLAEVALGDGFRANLHQKWRNRLVTAEKSGAKPQRARDLGMLYWLSEQDRRQQKSRGYRALPPAFTALWAETDPKSISLYHTGPAGDPTAAMLFLRHGKTATYHIGWAGDEGRKTSAHNLILARAARELADKGVTRLNLGLLDTETAPGLARFKLGAGARPQKTGGTWVRW